MESLSVRYRPKTFEEVSSQGSIIRILKRQLEMQDYTNCYGFFGPSGCGKTTIARIFGNQINGGSGEIIEIDGASNNGVDNVRAIIESANERSTISTYKVFIIDECHMISNAGWNAFLKTIEEPPKYTIFMFCTTNPEKIPATINNRIMRFNLTKVNTDLIKNRLEYICANEHFLNYSESCDYLAKLANGGMRDAIALLDICANYSTDLSINNVLSCLGDFSYDSFFNLTGSLLNGDEAAVLSTIENYYNSGSDLKLFIEHYLDFMLDLTKYCLFKNMSSVKIPNNLEPRCSGFVNNVPNALDYCNKYVDSILNIKNTIKYDVNIKTTIEAMMIKICRGV